MSQLLGTEFPLGKYWVRFCFVYIIYYLVQSIISIYISSRIIYWVSAMGTGRSKKEAKHAAAKAILEKLIGAEGDGIPPTKNGTPNSTEM